jgi:hypothetical protein
MPYIKRQDRIKIEYCCGKLNPITALINSINTEGELNYVITKLCLEFLNKKKKNYAVLNSIIGVLECAKQEFYRRIVSPYEDKKIQENGDIE